MLLIDCSKIKKYLDARLILDIDNLKIYSRDCIGIVGINGSGKTTLLNILSKKIEPSEGFVKLHGKYEFISQLESVDRKNISKEMASKFNVNENWNENMSGGEKTKFKIASALTESCDLIFADEPTSNLDTESIELLEEKVLENAKAVIVISHDRSFLDKICNQIIEIENGKIRRYKGNYSEYKKQKSNYLKRTKFEYEQYIKEKKRLENVIVETKQKSKSIKRTPKRMGNSEARLHKMGGQKSKRTLDKKILNVKKRIEHLEVKKNLKEKSKIKLDILQSSRSYSKVLVQGQNINKSFGDKVIFTDANFYIENSAKVALIGANGCGKSTLLKMIMENEKGIKISKSTKIGYFSQEMDILKPDLSIIENVMKSSIYNENFARLLLARLLFKKDSVYKKVKVLSGGELVKVSLAKILLEDFNMLIIDEPTNYLDIDSLEVIEKALIEYDRTLLFVSHDRRFIKNVANQIMTINANKIDLFKGNYEEFKNKNDRVNGNKKKIKEKKMILDNRLSEIISKLSISANIEDKDKLENEYNEILLELKKLKN